jgi:hypothetical protein
MERRPTIFGGVCRMQGVVSSVVIAASLYSKLVKWQCRHDAQDFRSRSSIQLPWSCLCSNKKAPAITLEPLTSSSQNADRNKSRSAKTYWFHVGRSVRQVTLENVQLEHRLQSWPSFVAMHVRVVSRVWQSPRCAVPPTISPDFSTADSTL